MLQIGVQTKNIVQDADPADGFRLLREIGFSAADFSLNGYLLNTNIYRSAINDFFNASVGDLEHFFQPHRDAAQAAGIRIHQMHMPYPAYVPQASVAVNTYLWQEMAPKSLQVCAFMGCRYLVMHGFKLAAQSLLKVGRGARRNGVLAVRSRWGADLGLKMGKMPPKWLFRAENGSQQGWKRGKRA